MAYSNRQTATSLKNQLTEKPKQYGYFQVIRLLRRIAGENVEFSRFLRDHVRIRPLLSLGFPETDVCDIRDISTADFPCFEITASFLGLYGPASPLPTYYTEELISEFIDEESVKKDFLDIVNDPVFKLFYESWSKYRLFVKIIDENDPDTYTRLFAFIGRSETAFRRNLPESRALLRYAGLFLCQIRSAEGLKTLIADFFGLPGVEIEQCVPRKVLINRDQQCLIGLQACKMGIDSHMGSQILDYSGKIRIRCGPVDPKRFHEIAPGTDFYEQLVRVVNAYLDQPLSVDVRLIISPREIHTTTLGGPTWCRLGYHTWLTPEGEQGCDAGPIEPNAPYELQTGTA